MHIFRIFTKSIIRLSFSQTWIKGTRRLRNVATTLQQILTEAPGCPLTVWLLNPAMKCYNMQRENTPLLGLKRGSFNWLWSGCASQSSWVSKDKQMATKRTREWTFWTKHAKAWPVWGIIGSFVLLACGEQGGKGRRSMLVTCSLFVSWHVCLLSMIVMKTRPESLHFHAISSLQETSILLTLYCSLPLYSNLELGQGEG